MAAYVKITICGIKVLNTCSKRIINFKRMKLLNNTVKTVNKVLKTYFMRSIYRKVLVKITIEHNYVFTLSMAKAQFVPCSLCYCQLPSKYLLPIISKANDSGSLESCWLVLTQGSYLFQTKKNKDFSQPFQRPQR